MRAFTNRVEQSYLMSLLSVVLHGNWRMRYYWPLRIAHQWRRSFIAAEKGLIQSPPVKLIFC
jgi:hypothetical protein